MIMSCFYKKYKCKITIRPANLVLLITIIYTLFFSHLGLDTVNKEKIYTFNTVTRIDKDGEYEYVKLDDIRKYKEFNLMLLDTIKFNGAEYVSVKTLKNAVNKILNMSVDGASNEKVAILETNIHDKTVEVYQASYKYKYSIRVLINILNIFAIILFIMIPAFLVIYDE